MAETDDSLVMRRPRRSTAGNRMAAALAEFREEELGQDVEEDADFEIVIDERDAFGSDFESTDEEGAQEDVDATAEKMVHEEERKRRKVVRSQLDKVTAAAHARQKATFNPQTAATEIPKTSLPPKFKRRVSLGTVVDAETGELMISGKRHSQRSHTVLNTSTSDALFKVELKKKSVTPKKVKTKITPPTQAELIARALDMEEDNINEHKNYLTLEEEKRKKARLVREAVDGPLIRWVSKREKIKVLVEPSRPPPSLQPLLNPMTPSTANPPYLYAYYPSAAMPSSTSTASPYSTAPAPYYTAPQNVQQAGIPYLQLMPPPPPLASELVEEEHTVAKNYVVHEVDQGEGAPRPLWKQTMGAMFGDHVNWEEAKVYTGRNRPLSRPVQACPITGQPAQYLDPRTNVPFANVHAYKTLTRLLGHEYVWSETLGCYTGFEDPRESTERS